MNEAQLLVLLSLAGGAQHGYAIQRDIEKALGVRLGPGTLYGAAARLEEAGFIAALPSSERRKPYRMTEAGLAHLRHRIKGMRALVALGEARLRSS